MSYDTPEQVEERRLAEEAARARREAAVRLVASVCLLSPVECLRAAGWYRRRSLLRATSSHRAIARGLLTR